MSETDYDVVVLGGGAAGLSGALLLARAGLRVAVADSGTPRNAPAAHMHGYLSRDGMPPSELLAAGRAEVAGYGGELVSGTVTSVSPGFHLTLADGRLLSAPRLLVTTGLRDELPDMPGLTERWGRDVIQCPYCHGHEVRDQPLGVLATGPGSVHHALLISQWSSDVVLFEHTHTLSGTERDELAAMGIATVSGTVTDLVVDNDKLHGIRLSDGSVVPRTTLFVGATMRARTDVLTALALATDDNGFITVDSTGATSTPGVWAAGNVVNPKAQVIVAAGAGAGAAMAIHGDIVRELVRRGVEANTGTFTAALEREVAEANSVDSATGRPYVRW